MAIYAALISLAVGKAIAPLQAQKSPKLAKCDGSKKRSANPYGTVLPTLDVAAVATRESKPPTPKADINLFGAPKPAPQATSPTPAHTVPEISLRTPAHRFESC
jgi:hypothetical protein